MMDLEMQSATIERLKPQISPFLRLTKLFLASIGIIFCVIWYQCSKTETYDKINSAWDLLTLHKRLPEKIHRKHSIPMAAHLLRDISQSPTALKYRAPPVLQLEKVETFAGHFNGRSSVSVVKSMMHGRRLSLLYPQEWSVQIPIALEADFASTEANVTPYVIPDIAPIVNTDNSSIELMTDITLSDAPTTTTTMIDQLPAIIDSAPQQLLEIKDATGVEDVQGMPTVLNRTAFNAEGVQQQHLQNAEPLSSVPPLRTTLDTLNDVTLEYLEI